MAIRWRAVFIGLLVDILLTTVVQVFARPDLFPMPDLAQQGDVLILIGTALSIGVGGYVAGRIAREGYLLNGLMVGVLDVLLTVIQAGAMSRPVVYMEVLGCGFAALGGFLSQFPQAAVQKVDKRD